MEITMYEDNVYSNNNSFSRENVAQMKRKFTLDLNRPTTKKIRVLQSPSLNPLLTSPDLNRLKLGSPELERLLINNGGCLPTGFSFPTPTSAKVFTPNTTVSSAEEFIKGFQDTLAQYHTQENNVAEVPISMSSSMLPISSHLQYTTLEPPQHHPQQSMLTHNHHHQVPVTTTAYISSEEHGTMCIKEEPRIVPSGTPPMSPIDMENQEKIKLERKRQRNRVAASKCRKRKLERISKLEDKVECLKNENTELQALVNKMRNQVYDLKQEVMDHSNSGCDIPFFSAQ